MNVSLTPELEKMVAEKVQSGMYNSASEVVRAGLRLLQEQDEERRLKLEALRRDIQVGLDEYEREEYRSIKLLSHKYLQPFLHFDSAAHFLVR